MDSPKDPAVEAVFEAPLAHIAPLPLPKPVTRKKKYAKAALVPHTSSSTSILVPAEHPSNRTMCCTSFVHGSGQRAEALFIPAGSTPTSTSLHDIMTKQWGVKVPSLFVVCDAGSAHPRTLENPELMALPAFRDWTRMAARYQGQGQGQVGQAEQRQTTVRGNQVAPLQPQHSATDDEIQVVSDLVHTKLILLFSGIHTLTHIRTRTHTHTHTHTHTLTHTHTHTHTQPC
jgi:hypothetical protein